MIVNQANLSGLNVSYSAAYNKAFDGVTTNHEKIATTVPSTTAETNYKWLGQIPQMREWIGDREIQSLSAYDYIIKNKKFEMTVSVPRDDIEDDQYGVYTPLFSNMGESAAQHPDILCFDALKAGFTEKCYDGKTFFAEDHPSGKGGKRTASNLSHDKLDADSYEAARTSMMSITGDKGKSLNLVPNLLVVSPANEKAARLILKADQINGTTNVLKDTAELLVATELADMPDAWFLLCTNRFLKPIIFQKRKEIKMTSLTKDDDQNVFMRDEFVWGADGRSNAGYGFWQMAYGSDGTEQSQG
ncbi:MAG: Mu-like prophage major head subunit gpT family protein [Roseburia sp.]|nr:Mu-like prophage major head subunit gpT family protein [Roseburia sp.]